MATDNKWQIAFWVMTSVLIVGIPTVTLAVSSEINNRVVADENINKGRMIGRLEIDKEVLDLRKETSDKFEIILQRLSSIEAKITVR